MLYKQITGSIEQITGSDSSDSFTYTPLNRDHINANGDILVRSYFSYLAEYKVLLYPNPDRDRDADGVVNSLDNCPNDYNPGQEDADGDGLGDLCDNSYPIADAGPDQAVQPDEVVTFDGSASFDENGIIEYAWDFESDSIFDAYGVTVTHSYALDDTYTVTLQITNSLQQSATDTAIVTVSQPSPENCDDGLDNDQDGLTDCQDLFDCELDPACVSSDPVIDTTSCDGVGVVNVTGSGFGVYTAGTSSVTYVERVCTGKGKNRVCTNDTFDCPYNYWDDILISADCGTCPADITVTTINGTLASPVPYDGTCTVTENPEVSCDDGFDNDCDGMTDGADSDCGTTVNCRDFTDSQSCTDAGCNWNAKKGTCR
jgi:hypothetical protein